MIVMPMIAIVKPSMSLPYPTLNMSVRSQIPVLIGRLDTRAMAMPAQIARIEKCRSFLMPEAYKPETKRTTYPRILAQR